MRLLFSQLVDLVIPPQCLVCDTRLTHYREIHCSGRRRYSILLCADCEPTSGGLSGEPPPAHAQFAGRVESFYCSCCGEPSTCVPGSGSRCVACQVWPPPLRYVRSRWRYGKEAERLVKALKYGKQRALAEYLAEQLIEIGLSEESEGGFPEKDWDIVIPIPSGTEQLRRRGFHHVALIASRVSKGLDLPLARGALYQTRRVIAQASLGAGQRLDNVRHAFAARDQEVSGRRVLLIDDVITTGATMWSAAWALLEAGATSVDGLSVARSRQFKSLRLVPSQQLGRDRTILEQALTA